MSLRVPIVIVDRAHSPGSLTARLPSRAPVMVGLGLTSNEFRFGSFAPDS